MSNEFLLFAGGEPSPPPPQNWPPSSPYAPLPPFPLASGQWKQPPDPQSGCWSGRGDYVRDLPFTPPNKPDRNYRRGNFQLKIPGFSGGYNDKDRSILMTWEASSIAEFDQRFCMEYYASLGLTHWLHSIPQTKNMGKGLAEFRSSLEYARASGIPFNVANVLGGDGESFERDVVPWLDTCGGLLDELCVAWQIDAGDKRDDQGRPYTQVIPELTERVSAYAKPNGLLVSQHWINGSCALWPDYPGQPGSEQYAARGITDRFSYGRWAADYVDCQDFQCDVDQKDAGIDEQQSGTSKVLEGLSGNTRLCVAEYEAQAQADNPKSGREPYALLKGYLMSCARRNGRVVDGGYFNGAARPNGSVL